MMRFIYSSDQKILAGIQNMDQLFEIYHLGETVQIKPADKQDAFNFLMPVLDLDLELYLDIKAVMCQC
jgi:hypothetical protein